MIDFLVNQWLIKIDYSIDNLVVPPVVEEGEDEVVLDCPFSFTSKEEQEEDMQLSWFFNDSPEPFYKESNINDFY